MNDPLPERVMVLTLPPPLESALAAQAGRRGLAPEELAVELLGRHLLPPVPQDDGERPADAEAAVRPARREPFVPRDDWERLLLSAASDCGVSLSDEALSREALYD